MKPTRVIQLFGPLLVLIGSTAAADPLEQFFSEVRTFSADFAQTVLDESFNIIDESSGSMWIERPGRFRWNYDPPAEQEIISDGEKVWVYDPALEQVTVRDFSAALGETPAMLLAGEGDLDSRYRVEALGDQGGGLHWYYLTPLAEDAQFTSIRLAFRSQALSIIELIDPLDQSTRIVLSSITSNPSVNPALFSFEAPPGVDVIDESR